MATIAIYTLALWSVAISQFANAASPEWPSDWSKAVGQSVTVEGVAVSAKLGALVASSDGSKSIWVDGLPSWPGGFYLGDDKNGRPLGKKVRVSGTVVVRSDLPVFVPKVSDPIAQGMPVPKGTDLERARLRYLLSKPKWKALN